MVASQPDRKKRCCEKCTNYEKARRINRHIFKASPLLEYTKSNQFEELPNCSSVE